MSSLAHRVFSSTPAATLAVGARPGPHAIQSWIADRATRAALAAFLESKGEMRRNEALLCALCWLAHRPGEAERAGADDAPAPAAGPRWVSAGEVTAYFGGCRFDHALSSTASMLRRAVACGLAEVEGRGWFRPTELGAAVCAALPDRRAAAALRGVRVTLPRGKWRTAAYDG